MGALDAEAQRVGGEGLCGGYWRMWSGRYEGSEHGRADGGHEGSGGDSGQSG